MRWFITATVVAALVTPLAITALRRLGVMDVPNHRSMHRLTVVRGGGVAPAAVVLVGAVLVAELRTAPLAGWVLAGALTMAMLGLLDDLGAGISATLRLAIQAAASAVVISGLVIASDLSGISAVLLATAGVIGVVGFVNAFNFMDGINGIAGLQAGAAGAVIAVAGALTDAPWLTTAGALLAGAALGFLPWNFPVARTFLGDVGSYFLGAWISLVLAAAVATGLPAQVAIGVVAVYVADTTTCVLQRVRRGRKWSEPHRDHLYQRLATTGWSHPQVSAFVTGWSLLAGASGLLALFGGATAHSSAVAGILLAVTGYLVVGNRRVAARTDVAAASMN